MNEMFKSNNQCFIENEDYISVLSDTVVNNGVHPDLRDYLFFVDIVKHICLISRIDKGTSNLMLLINHLYGGFFCIILKIKKEIIISYERIVNFIRW